MAQPLGPPIDLDELQDEIASAKVEFDRWAHATIAAADNLKAKYFSTVKETRETIAALQERGQMLAAKAEDLRRRLATERERESQLRSELESVLSEERALPAQLAQLQQRLAVEEEEYLRARARLETDRAGLDRKLGSLRECVSMYEACLGLTFRQGENEELQLLFNQIDPRTPDRIFMFAVRVSDDNKYHVTQCQPALSGTDELLYDLNSNPDSFYVFVRRMRKKFQQLAAMGL